MGTDLNMYKGRAKNIKNSMSWVALREEMRRNGCTEADILEVNSFIKRNNSPNIVESLAIANAETSALQTGASLISISISEGSEFKHIRTLNNTLPLEIQVPKELLT